jgi:succinate dehydrogenase / fumarate reductase cytochrome b subunit
MNALLDRPAKRPLNYRGGPAELVNLLKKLWCSTVGRKYIVAVTGAVLLLFIVTHLLGNVLVFWGPDAINIYGEVLHSRNGLLWVARAILLVSAILHVWVSVALALGNDAARPVPYDGNPAPLAASYASRTMVMSGLILGAFVIYHLLHFTIHTDSVNLLSDPVLKNFRMLHDAEGRPDVFRMMVAGFSHPLVAGFYIFAMALLCLHLSHGLKAMLQSVGWRSFCPTCLDRLAVLIALLIFMGYVSIPIAILVFGFGKSSL